MTARAIVLLSNRYSWAITLSLICEMSRKKGQCHQLFYIYMYKRLVHKYRDKFHGTLLCFVVSVGNWSLTQQGQIHVFALESLQLQYSCSQLAYYALASIRWCSSHKFNPITERVRITLSSLSSYVMLLQVLRQNALLQRNNEIFL